MKTFIKTLLVSLLINIPTTVGICILLQFNMTLFDIIVIALICSLIGLILAYAIRYAIKLAKEHQV